MITTLTGINSYQLKLELDRRVKDFLKEYGDMGLERLDGEEVNINRISEAMQSLPFLVSQKLLVLRSPSANKQFIEQAQALLADIPDGTTIILYEPKLDKRSSYYKFLKTKTDFHEYNEMDEQQLIAWLSNTAKDRGGLLKVNDARFLVERVGAYQQLLGHELDKLLLYEPQITHQNIELLTEPAPQGTVFALLDAAFEGDVSLALKLYEDQRRQKIEPQQMLAMLVWQLHILAVVKTAGSRSPDEIARTAGISPFVVRKSLKITNKLTLQHLKNLIHQVLELDIDLKSKSLDIDEALKNLLIKVADY